MPEIEVPYPTCSGTANMTPGGGRNNLKDRCTTCGGRRTIPARPGESRETSWPFAVPGAPQPPSSTPGEVERLVDALISVARTDGWSEGFFADAGMESPRKEENAQSLARARTALLPHISTAGRGEGAVPDDAAQRAYRARRLNAAIDAFLAHDLAALGDRMRAALSAADAINPQDQE